MVAASVMISLRQRLACFVLAHSMNTHRAEMQMSTNMGISAVPVRTVSGELGAPGTVIIL